MSTAYQVRIVAWERLPDPDGVRVTISLPNDWKMPKSETLVVMSERDYVDMKRSDKT